MSAAQCASVVALTRYNRIEHREACTLNGHRNQWAIRACQARGPVASPPLPVIRNGQLLRRNMRREFITENELMSYLRQQGIEDAADVKVAYIEPEGKVTAIRK